MDYEFLRDITGVVKVRMSMDHEAIGHWFNEEVKDNLPCWTKSSRPRAPLKAVNVPGNASAMNTRYGWTAKK